MVNRICADLSNVFEYVYKFSLCEQDSYKYYFFC